jgi:hypothetical protein
MCFEEPTTVNQLYRAWAQLQQFKEEFNQVVESFESDISQLHGRSTAMVEDISVVFL